MRHKYATDAIVLSRTPVGEAAILVTLLTSELGLIRARAEGLRRPGAKLAHALQTLNESEVTLVRGKEGWRLSGALLERAWFRDLTRPARSRAGRVAGLLLRLVHGEVSDPALHAFLRDFIAALPGQGEEEQDASECIAALRLLFLLGLDAGPIPEVQGPLPPSLRREIIARINQGLVASGL